MFQVGVMIRMILPDNPRVNNHVGVIKEMTSYGAKVNWNGGSGEFRLLFNEMQFAKPTGNVCMKCGSGNQVRAGTCLLCLDCGDTSGGCG